MKYKLKVIGFTLSISFVMFIALVIFLKGLGVLWNDWFVNNAVWLTITSGIILLLGVITGSIGISNVLSKGKSIF